MTDEDKEKLFAMKYFIVKSTQSRLKFVIYWNIFISSFLTLIQDVRLMSSMDHGPRQMMRSLKYILICDICLSLKQTFH